MANQYLKILDENNDGQVSLGEFKSGVKRLYRPFLVDESEYVYTISKNDDVILKQADQLVLDDEEDGNSFDETRQLYIEGDSLKFDSMTFDEVEVGNKKKLEDQEASIAKLNTQLNMTDTEVKIQFAGYERALVNHKTIKDRLEKMHAENTSEKAREMQNTEIREQGIEDLEQFSSPLIVDSNGDPYIFLGNSNTPIDMDKFSSLLSELPEAYTQAINIYKGTKYADTRGMSDFITGHRLSLPFLFKYMRGLVDENVTVYVNLNEYILENEYKRKIYSYVCSSKNCFYYWIPVRDYHCPTYEQMSFWLKICKWCRETQRKMVYHCGSGKGRTGFMTICNILSLEFQWVDADKVKGFINQIKESVPKELGNWDYFVDCLTGDMEGRREMEPRDTEGKRIKEPLRWAAWLKGLKSSELYIFLVPKFIAEQSFNEILNDGPLFIRRIILLECLWDDKTKEKQLKGETIEIAHMKREKDEETREKEKIEADKKELEEVHRKEELKEVQRELAESQRIREEEAKEYLKKKEDHDAKVEYIKKMNPNPDRPPLGLISYEELLQKRHKNDDMETPHPDVHHFPDGCLANVPGTDCSTGTDASGCGKLTDCQWTSGERFTVDDWIRMFVSPDNVSADGWRERQKEEERKWKQRQEEYSREIQRESEQKLKEYEEREAQEEQKEVRRKEKRRSKREEVEAKERSQDMFGQHGGSIKKYKEKNVIHRTKRKIKRKQNNRKKTRKTKRKKKTNKRKQEK